MEDNIEMNQILKVCENLEKLDSRVEMREDRTGEIEFTQSEKQKENKKGRGGGRSGPQGSGTTTKVPTFTSLEAQKKRGTIEQSKKQWLEFFKIW